MRLVWARYALDDRDTIFSYIEGRIRGRRSTSTRRSSARYVVCFPESGRPGRVAGTRELVIPRTPYIAAYMLMADRIRILRVLHGAQNWPSELDDE
ncbi:type II toxin-antitoxin system mRNA interferase toxin, RelE/StbE family [Sinorhizobium meliloti]|uniref:type II toxin-antitoxin system RelE/ParE family toxin n=1 Tax=Rhizobium meliloti TaxID=382 RepID=UPI001295BF3B|nr:type II toxin-antitoxin system RelE/ParE family toxin [Sinorhizobium meliloti]MQW61593.1 type II toxin-antitoxin system mRNA interferase toxin, RelE/StbE family [Sinorhizobium meliloti]